MVKRVIVDADVSVDTEWRTDEIWIQNSGIRTSLVNIRRLKQYHWFEDGAMKANTLMSPRRTGGQRRIRQCSGHVYRLDLLLRQQQNAFDPIVIIIELLYRIVYRDNFDLSYRLSIGNSIWHIVTALKITSANIHFIIYF